MNKVKFHITDILSQLKVHNISYMYDGNLDISVYDMASLDMATSGDITWFAHAKYIDVAKKNQDSVIITTESLKSYIDTNAIVVDNPRLAYAKIKQYMHPNIQSNGYIAHTANIADTVKMGNNVQINDFAIIGSGAVLQDNVIIGAYVYIGENTSIGQNTHIQNYCHIQHAKIGSDCGISAHCTIGTDGFGFVLDTNNGHQFIPHTGKVIIEDNVHIGAQTCIDKGVEDNTVIGKGTRIDNLVHIAHNVQIGKHCVIPAQVGIAGSVRIGDGVIFGGQSGVTEKTHINKGSIVLSGSLVWKDVAENQIVSGTPARSHKENLKKDAYINKLVKQSKE